MIKGGIDRCENGTDETSDRPGPGNCESNGLYYYPKCQYLAKVKGYKNADKWTNDGCCICSPESGYRSLSFEGNATCNDDEFLNTTLGRCYKKCPHGGKNTGFGTCTLGASAMVCNDDEFLNPDIGRCYKNCPPGYTNTGVSCYRPVSTLGMDSMLCKDNEDKEGARCYTPKIFPGFTSMGEFASYGRSTYDRGAGTPSVRIRPKKRIAPYSTQDN
jgi:hypothetical protein